MIETGSATSYPDGTHDHRWQEGQQREYNWLTAKGRALYDSLRYEGRSHDFAWAFAYSRFGMKGA